VETIAATTNKNGLTVQAVLDANTYETGIRITDKEMRVFESRHLRRHEFHGEWNYTVHDGSGLQADDTTTLPRSPK
jgi:hypothetical protein